MRNRHLFKFNLEKTFLIVALLLLASRSQALVLSQITTGSEFTVTKDIVFEPNRGVFILGTSNSGNLDQPKGWLNKSERYPVASYSSACSVKIAPERGFVRIKAGSKLTVTANNEGSLELLTSQNHTVDLECNGQAKTGDWIYGPSCYGVLGCRPDSDHWQRLTNNAAFLVSTVEMQHLIADFMTFSMNDSIDDIGLARALAPTNDY